MGKSKDMTAAKPLPAADVPATEPEEDEADRLAGIYARIEAVQRSLSDPEKIDKINKHVRKLEKLIGDEIILTPRVIAEAEEAGIIADGAGDGEATTTATVDLLTTQLLDKRIDIGGRVISLAHGVDEFDSEDLDLKIRLLNKFTDDVSRPIELIIDSNYGGSVYSLLGMISIIRLSPSPIHTMTRGCAMSAGALLVISGAKGHRRITRETTLMLHDMITGNYGSFGDVKVKITQDQRLHDQLYAHIAANSKKSVEWWEKRLQRDSYFDATEALKYGLVDEII